MIEQLAKAVAPIEAAEKMAPAGSYEHSQYVKAALMSAWPTIRAYVHFETKKAAPPPKE